MNTTIIISLLGVVISLYTVTSPVQKRNLRFKFDLTSYGTIITFVTLIVISVFFEGYYNIEGNDVTRIIGSWSFTYSYFYSCVSFVSAFLVAIYFYSRLNSRIIRNLNDFLENIKIQVNTTKYTEAVNDLSFYKDTLFRNYSSNTRKPVSNENMFWRDEKKLSKFRIFMNKVHNFYYRNTINRSEKIDKLIEGSIKDDSFTNTLIMIDPEFAIDLLESELTGKTEFAEKIFKSFFMNFESSFFYQIKHTDSISGERYLINEEMYILFKILRNTELSQELKVYKPVGESLKEYIRELGLKERDYGLDIFVYEEDLYDNPIYLGINFFDILVREAIASNYNWHMWLFYLTSFANEIVRKIEYPDTNRMEHNGYLINYEYFCIGYIKFVVIG